MKITILTRPTELVVTISFRRVSYYIQHFRILSNYIYVYVYNFYPYTILCYYTILYIYPYNYYEFRTKAVRNNNNNYTYQACRRLLGLGFQCISHIFFLFRMLDTLPFELQIQVHISILTTNFFFTLFMVVVHFSSDFKHISEQKLIRQDRRINIQIHGEKSRAPRSN